MTPIHARGATLAEAFAGAALALLAGAVEPGAIPEAETREVRAHGVNPEALLAHFLNECTYILEVEGFAWRRVDFAVFEAVPGGEGGAEPLRLHAFLRGAPLPAEADGGDPIPPLSAAMVAIRAVAGGYEVSAGP